ncbi:hypothetical protein NE237_015191 [Protea cynaroides]|uniref:Protein RALF-like 32 n=1 Tax=Protea cynaroides TaxID=273540 RepID=A0A9Q0QQU1_9MAGN|nr:hypothetical protein NE237_015191 [Protea cynaroides]
MESSNFCRSLHLLFPLLLVIFLPVVCSATLRCNGSIAECNEEEELLMESEIARRFLQGKQKYISYGAIKQNLPVCGGGASGEAYTRSGSCLTPPSNSQNRGCSKYYRCRSNS